MLSPEPWHSNRPPRRVLIIRMQALGDVVITLPYALALKNALPDSTVDFLTRDEVAGIPEHAGFFARVHIVWGKRNRLLNLLSILLLLPRLLLARYDVLIDLQNNRLSRIVGRVLRCRAYAEFDRFSPIAAGIRTLDTINATGLGPIVPEFDVASTLSSSARRMLIDFGWDAQRHLIVLNPAGFLPSRNWPLESYVAFTKVWLRQYDAEARFLLLGLAGLRDKERFLRQEIGDRLISLVGKTSPEEAFAALQFAQLVLSEDSGLMHMAWVRGIPTLALFGSSRSDWSRPLGSHSICLSSADLDCGECMLARCKFGDNRCLTRYSPEVVAAKAHELLRRTHAEIEDRSRYDRRDSGRSVQPGYSGLS